MDKKIIFISDMAFQGSGYLQISVPLCKGLAEKGYQIFVIGINYAGQEHDFPFTIIPCQTFQDAQAMVVNLYHLEKPDAMIVALDIPHQGFFLEGTKPHVPDMKYVCITPLENPPLTMSWAAPLLNCDAVFFISQTATDAAHKAGLIEAQHIQIGMEPHWRFPTEEERARIRKTMNVEDKFVVLTVADNQERKNLWAGMEIIRHAKKAGMDNLKYIIITREHLPFGYKFRDFATEMNLNDELTIVERGLPFDLLWTYYAAADVFLLPSKAEGLGLPVMEAMASGLPVLASETGAIPELLADGRGYLIPPEYSFRDVWGNGRRDMVDIEAGAKLLREMMDADLSEMKQKAKAFTDTRTWNVAIEQLDSCLEKITDGQKEAV